MIGKLVKWLCKRTCPYADLHPSDFVDEEGPITVGQTDEDQVKEVVRVQVRREVQRELKAELKADLRAEIKEELMEELRAEIMEEMKAEVRNALKEELKKELEEMVYHETKISYKTLLDVEYHRLKQEKLNYIKDEAEKKKFKEDLLQFAQDHGELWYVHKHHGDGHYGAGSKSGLVCVTGMESQEAVEVIKKREEASENGVKYCEKEEAREKACEESERETEDESEEEIEEEIEGGIEGEIDQDKEEVEHANEEEEEEGSEETIPAIGFRHLPNSDLVELTMANSVNNIQTYLITYGNNNYDGSNQNNNNNNDIQPE